MSNDHVEVCLLRYMSLIDGAYQLEIKVNHAKGKRGAKTKMSGVVVYWK